MEITLLNTLKKTRNLRIKSEMRTLFIRKYEIDTFVTLKGNNIREKKICIIMESSWKCANCLLDNLSCDLANSGIPTYLMYTISRYQLL